MSMVYYTDVLEGAIRFGDVVKGWAVVHASQDKLSPPQYTISVEMAHSVVLTPTCSIRDHTICVAPLRKADPYWFLNPHFEEDLTRINFPVSPEKSVPDWSRIPEPRKSDLLAEGSGYTFWDMFVFPPHEKLGTYTLTVDEKPKRTLTVGHYAVSFRDIVKVECKNIQSAESSPVDCKVLQLTDDARQALLEKLLNYFSRVKTEIAGP